MAWPEAQECCDITRRAEIMNIVMGRGNSIHKMLWQSHRGIVHAVTPVSSHIFSLVMKVMQLSEWHTALISLEQHYPCHQLLSARSDGVMLHWGVTLDWCCVTLSSRVTRRALAGSDVTQSTLHSFLWPTQLVNRDCFGVLRAIQNLWVYNK